ncbi:MAG: aminopeptidase [Desulfobacteraceae bacterium]|jgi:aminopeptidase
MFTKKELNNYADALIWGLMAMNDKAELISDDVVYLRGDYTALPLLEVLHRKLLELRLDPMLKLGKTEQMEVDFYNIAEGKQLNGLYPWWKDEFKHVRGSIYVYAPLSLTHLKDAPVEKQQTMARSITPFREFLDEQENKGLFSWTLGMWPTQCLADHAGLTLEEYKDQIVKACYLDSDDAVASWEKTQSEIDFVKSWLDALTPKVNYFHLESKNIDLKITPGKDRMWLGGRGANIPSFEIFTSPDWRGTNGVFYANQPSFRSGHLVRGVRLEFKDGLVVKASAEEGEDYLISTLDTDEGARKVGEFSLTDKRHSKIDKFMADTLFDENFGGKHGNSHIAVGNSYETYTKDVSELDEEKKKELGFSSSVVHWDLVNTEDKKATAVMKDGSKTVIYEDGMFTL